MAQIPTRARNDAEYPLRVSALESTADVCHVWLNKPSAVDRSFQDEILSDEERARASRFAFDRDKDLYRAAHLLARRALSACEPRVRPAEWVFTQNPHGRPEVAGPSLESRLRFNISHTAGLVACVVTRNVDCGIDVERSDRKVDIESLGSNALTRAEIEAVRELPQAARAEAFFRRWTLKEAYAKARGLGMALPFNELAVDLAPPIRIVGDAAIESEPGAWQLASWSVGPCLAAIALRRGSAHTLRIVRHRAPPGQREGA